MELSEMNRDELQAARRRLMDDLEDHEDMTRFNFTNSSDHIPPAQVQAQRVHAQRLQDQIAEIEALLEKSAS